MLEIPDDFEINRSVIKENSSFQELNTLLEETRNFMYEMSFLAYGRDNIVLHRHKGILDEKFDEYLRSVTGMQI